MLFDMISILSYDDKFDIITINSTHILSVCKSQISTNDTELEKNFVSAVTIVCLKFSVNIIIKIFKEL